MIAVYCFTNLDLHHEEWPTFMAAVPNVGDCIQSKTKHGVFQLQLQVVSITWKWFVRHSEQISGFYPEIELHMTEGQKRYRSKDPEAADGSITAFYEWYAPKVGRTVGSFI
jgi:hypothetical protein